MQKKYSITLLVVFLIILGISSFLLRQRSGQEACEVIGKGPIEITLFYSETCAVCAKAKIFLQDLTNKYPEIRARKCNISKQKVVEKLIRFYEEYNVPKESFGAVPAIFTREKYFIGFNSRIAQEIDACILECQQAGLIGEEDLSKTSEENIVNIPIIGEIDVSKYSLPALSVIFGFFDGFNVCSLGALVLILALVLALKSRKKILIFGSIFILATAIIYGILLVLWYQVFSFFAQYLKFMEILIGLLGVFGAVYFLNQFIKFRKLGPACELETGKGIVSRFSNKMQNVLKGEKSIFALTMSILLFAAVITIVEFPCSAAVPVFFAGVLAKARLPVFYYLLYIAIFVLFYMIDEIIVFLLALFTMTIKIANKKFVVWLTLIEAVVLFLLGIYYLFGFLIF